MSDTKTEKIRPTFEQFANGLYYNWHEEGGALIVTINHRHQLYEVPRFGGKEQYFNTYDSIEEAKTEADKWT